MIEVRNLDKIRIKEEEISFFKERIKALDRDAELYVYGSRADMTKKGGDIDLVILSHENLDKTKLSNVKHEFRDVFGKQKIDLVNFTYEENPPFKKLIMSDAIEV